MKSEADDAKNSTALLHVFWLRNPAQRDARDQRVVEVWIGEHVRDQGCANKGRRDNVDIDLVRRPFRRKLLAQNRQPALRCAVGGIAAPPQTKQRSHRSDMHLLAASFLLHHVASRGFCLEHRALQVHVEHVIELFFGDLFRLLLAVQTDAVDQNVEAAKMGSYFIDHPLCLRH